MPWRTFASACRLFLLPVALLVGCSEPEPEMEVETRTEKVTHFAWMTLAEPIGGWRRGDTCSIHPGGELTFSSLTFLVEYTAAGKPYGAMCPTGSKFSIATQIEEATS